MLIITAIKMPKLFPDQSHSKMSGQSLLYQGTEMMAEPLLPCRSYNAAYPISFLPKECLKTPSVVRQRIRRNEQIIRQRKKEARANKGHYTTKIPLER